MENRYRGRGLQGNQIEVVIVIQVGDDAGLDWYGSTGEKQWNSGNVLPVRPMG